LYELPSDPVTVTCVAFVAVTVRVDELPDAIDVGLTLIPTMGAVGGAPELPLKAVPQPVNSRHNERLNITAVSRRMRERNEATRTFNKVFSFQIAQRMDCKVNK
jgi:hypothetical protein